MNNLNMFAQRGWVCPCCDRVYSPTTPMCYYCGSKEFDEKKSDDDMPTDEDYMAALGPCGK